MHNNVLGQSANQWGGGGGRRHGGYCQCRSLGCKHSFFIVPSLCLHTSPSEKQFKRSQAHFFLHCREVCRLFQLLEKKKGKRPVCKQGLSLDGNTRHMREGLNYAFKRSRINSHAGTEMANYNHAAKGWWCVWEHFFKSALEVLRKFKTSLRN